MQFLTRKSFHLIRSYVNNQNFSTKGAGKRWNVLKQWKQCSEFSADVTSEKISVDFSTFERIFYKTVYQNEIKLNKKKVIMQWHSGLSDNLQTVEQVSRLRHWRKGLTMSWQLWKVYFSAFLTKGQRNSAYFSVLLCKVFKKKLLTIQRISVDSLDNNHKISLSGIVTANILRYGQILLFK